jgi:hypothetical protein
MKRLLDESPDELTRSLLVAGIEHRPDPGNKARVIMAIGAGGTFALFSSNAFAWLGTTAGKVSAAGVAVGVAGALFIVAPRLLSAGPGQDPALHAATPRGAAVSANVAAPLETAPAASTRTASAPSSLGSLADSAASSAVISDSAFPASAASEKAAPKKLSAWRERRLAARKREARSAAASSPAALSPAALSPVALSAPAAVSAPVALSASESVREGRSPAAATSSAPGSPATEGASVVAARDELDSEVRLVDDMHWAARRNDREALSRFLERYRETFPDGQLKKEVAEFAARLAEADTTRAP